jgi:hypothetical protein
MVTYTGTSGGDQPGEDGRKRKADDGDSDNAGGGEGIPPQENGSEERSQAPWGGMIGSRSADPARTANPRDFMDARFIQEFDKSGYIDSLYK